MSDLFLACSDLLPPRQRRHFTAKTKHRKLRLVDIAQRKRCGLPTQYESTKENVAGVLSSENKAVRTDEYTLPKMTENINYTGRFVVQAEAVKAGGRCATARAPPITRGLSETNKSSGMFNLIQSSTSFPRIKKNTVEDPPYGVTRGNTMYMPPTYLRGHGQHSEEFAPNQLPAFLQENTRASMDSALPTTAQMTSRYGKPVSRQGRSGAPWRHIGSSTNNGGMFLTWLEGSVRNAEMSRPTTAAPARREPIRSAVAQRNAEWWAPEMTMSY